MKSPFAIGLRNIIALPFCLMVLILSSLSSCTFVAQIKPLLTEKKTTLNVVSPEYLISSEGIGQIKLSDTHDSLLQKFGNQVSEHENSVNGTFTSVWYNQPDEVNVFWKEKTPPFKTVKYIEINKTDGHYLTKDSLFLGQSLWDVIRVNGFKSIRFVNLSQQESPGLITTFNGGNIEKNIPNLSAVLELGRIQNVHKNEYAKFVKKKEISSSDPLLNRIEYELVSIRIHAKQ